MQAKELLERSRHIKEQVQSLFLHSQELRDASGKKHLGFNSSIQLNENSTPSKNGHIFSSGYSASGTGQP